MRADIFGKATGYCKGKGGSMHLAVFEKKVMLCDGILGPNQTINNGIALAIKKKGLTDIAVVMYGDGAAQRGEFHEALNLAAIWKLPVLSICVNNEYAMSGWVDELCSVKDISSRAASYGLPGFTVDGCDVLAVYQAVEEAAKSIRAGKGPVLLELKTTRWRPHVEGEPDIYRSPQKKEEIRKRDCIKRLGDVLKKKGMATESELQKLRDEVQQELQEAIAFTEKSAYPPLEEITTDLYYEERRAD
jgi:TPP-dependent pyruvate/acetoin dehydrogenase alpha subunit